jgi:hypothetical protein
MYSGLENPTPTFYLPKDRNDLSNPPTYVGGNSTKKMTPEQRLEQVETQLMQYVKHNNDEIGNMKSQLQMMNNMLTILVQQGQKGQHNKYDHQQAPVGKGKQKGGNNSDDFHDGYDSERALDDSESWGGDKTQQEGGKKKSAGLNSVEDYNRRLTLA